MPLRLALAAAAAATALAAAAPARADIVPVTASGADPAAIQPTVDDFRSSLGPDNGAAPGSQADGRRQVSWDAVPDALSSPALLPGDFFDVQSPRGLILTTPGRGVAVSRTPGQGQPRFADVDPSYAGSFQAFSPDRIFAPMGSDVTYVSFRVPGTDTPALVRGFAAVFTSVDAAGATSVALLGADGSVLGTVDAPTGAMSFAGATGDGIAGARITTGNAALAAGTRDDATHDVVAMDDFVYGEPRAPLAAFSLGQAAYGVHENDGALVVTVRRSGALGAASVHVATAGGTATSGADFTPVAQTLSFAPGQTERSVSVPVLRDRARHEPDETFAVALDHPTGGVLGSPASAVVTLHNDAPVRSVDRTRPRVRISHLRRTQRRTRFLRGVRLSVTTNETASLHLSLLASARRAVISRAFNLTLGQRTFARARGKRAVRVRPSRRLVGSARHLTVRLRVLAIDTAGNRRTVTRRIHVVSRR
jgi:hypothetical protein